VLTTNDISSRGFDAVPRVTLGYRYQDGVAVEASYFGWNDWAGSASLASSPMGNPSVVFVESPDTLAADKVSTSLTTSLNSAEINVSQTFPNNSQFEFLSGLRYLRFGEQFNFHAERTAGGDLDQNNYSIQTTNNLYGAQVGLRWARSWKRLSINGTGKTGVYANDATQNQLLGYSSNANSLVIRDLMTSKPGVSLVQELGLNGVFQMTDRWSIRGGYNLFVISGLARTGDQIDFSSTAVPSLNTHGTAVLHGPSAGIEFRF